MRAPLLLFCALILAHAPSAAAAPRPLTALEAARLLPEEQAKNLARIEGRPDPDGAMRWYLGVHDPAEPNGVREYVVANGAIVSSRNISQFTPSLKPQDIIGRENVRVDSAAVREIASDLARRGKRRLTALNYRLFRESAGEPPEWLVQGFDEQGREVGQLEVNAADGTLLARDGFGGKADKALRKKQRMTTFAEVEVGRGEPTPPPTAMAQQRGRRRGGGARSNSGVTRTFRKVGGSLQRFFTGRDTISR